MRVAENIHRLPEGKRSVPVVPPDCFPRREPLKSRTFLIAVAAVWGGMGASLAQDRPENLTPLKLELTMSRPEGGGEPARASYTLYVLAEKVQFTQLRIGREVAVPFTTKGGADGPAGTGYQYRNVGMNIMCRAFRDEKGFRIHLSLERSTLFEEGAPVGPVGYPSFQTFNTEAEFLLADGHRVQVVTGSDPALGGWNVEAKLEVLK
jgi:hypothetical protein